MFYIVVLAFLLALWTAKNDKTVAAMITSITFVVLVCTTCMINDFMQTNIPSACYIASVRELPVYTIIISDGEIKFIILKNSLNKRSSDGFQVRRLTDIVSYIPTDKTKIYAVEKRFRLYWIFPIFSSTVLTDKNPLEPDDANLHKEL